MGFSLMDETPIAADLLRFTTVVSETDEGAATSQSKTVGPLRAIRRHCLDCSGGKPSEVTLCVSERCSLWLLRSGTRPTADEIAAVAIVQTHPSEVPMTQGELMATKSQLKAIRRRCLDCSGYNQAEVKNCKHTGCDLHPFRMGTNPARAGLLTLSDEQRAINAQRLRQRGQTVSA